MTFSLFQSFWEGYGEALFTEKGSPYRVPLHISSAYSSSKAPV